MEKFKLGNTVLPLILINHMRHIRTVKNISPLYFKIKNIIFAKYFEPFMGTNRVKTPRW
jgi:hypothetical protein